MQTMTRRSIIVAGRQTSISLENSFWNRLKDIAVSQEVTLSELVDDIDMSRPSGDLASAIRQFVLAHDLNGRSKGMTGLSEISRHQFTSLNGAE